ncbi:MAG: phosphoglyceromutase [Saprospiraceae bacterium]|nr:phosphoglyceromutase [Saprospiraceae bacterium]
MSNKLLLTCLFLVLLSFQINRLTGQDRKTQHVVLITLDGLRWQDLFFGADDSLVHRSEFVKDIRSLDSIFGGTDFIEKRHKLMPFFWDTLATKGQLVGNRKLNSPANVTNIHWFSYPGYNEILTGYTDPMINTNNKIYNPNITVLEWLHQKQEFRGKIAAFGSWDVFPYIINDVRSGIPVNAGFEGAEDGTLSWKEKYLNELQRVTPSPWSSVRLDVFTHEYAKEYIQKYHPRVVFISYGETDDFAHDGRYDHYLHSARRTDGFIHDLWNFYQRDSLYAGKTTFLITTDHGRGDIVKKEWTSHGKIIKGSNEIWMAAIGPDVPPLGERKDTKVVFQRQVASTLAAILGYTYESKEDVGKAIEFFLK